MLKKEPIGDDRLDWVRSQPAPDRQQAGREQAAIDSSDFFEAFASQIIGEEVMKYNIAAAAVSLSLWTVQAHAENIVRPQLISTPAKKAAHLLPDNQYAIELRCSDRNGALQDPSDFFNSRNRSLFVLIAPNAPSTVDKLPSDALAAVQVYSIGTDKTTKALVLVDDRHCSKDFLINGTKDISIVVTDNRLDDFSNSTFGQVLSSALGLLSPLFSLFTGAGLPAVITGKFDSVTAVQKAMSDILTALNRGQNYTHPIRNLQVGTYVVRSDYANVTINIRPVPSIVLDKNPAFKNDMKAQITSATVKVDASNMTLSCHGATYDIYSLGFRAPVDLAYSLMHVGAHAGFSVPQSVTCLTDKYAPAAASADDRFWSNFPPGFRVTAKDVTDTLSPPNKQPSWETVEPTLDTLVTALAQFARNNPAPQDAIDDLTANTTANLVIKDKTIQSKIGSNGSGEDRFTALNRLKKAGYIRFGCYAPTDDTTDQKIDGATSMFLVFNVPNERDSAKLSEALVVRPQFSGKMLSGLALSNNRAWATAILKKRDYDCNDFSVDRPAAEIANR